MKPRDPIVQTLLSFFIPFYIIYWSYVTGKEMEATYGHRAPNIWLLLAPIIVFIVGLMFFLIALVNASDNNSVAGGVGMLLMLFVIFPLAFALSLIYYYKFSDVVEKIVGPSASRLLVFILFWFISPAAVYIIQEKLNELNQANNQQNSHPPQSPVA